MIRRKIASRIEARRQQSGGRSGSFSSQDDKPPSQQEEDNGFTLVEDDELATEEYRSRRQEDGEEEQEDAPPKVKPWQEVSKEVYEQQLEVLQEQLMTTMMENQALKGDLQEQRSVSDAAKTELAELQRKHRALAGEVKRSASSSSGASNKRVSSPQRSDGSRSSYGGSSLSVSEGEEGYQNVLMQQDSIAARQQQRQRSQNRARSRVTTLKEWVYELLADFTDDSVSLADQSEEEPPLSARKLKENLQRLNRTSKPVRGMADRMRGLLGWSKVGETLVFFLIYMYCVWHGWVIPLVLLLAIGKVTLNYLHASGLAEQFGFRSEQRTFEEPELGLGDKIQLVKQVGQTVQNLSGQLADVLEKSQNLLCWHHPEAARRLYTFLWLFFVSSLFLPNSYLLTIAGLGIGIKLFIIDNIYRKYPKVKQKYDTVARLWAELPTNAELLRRQSLHEREMRSRPTRSYSTDSGMSTCSTGGGGGGGGGGDEGGGGPPVTGLSEEEIAFCTRFQLSPSELPLPSWQSGRRCSVMDRDKPLSLTRSGKLYLTHSFLCFERSGRAAVREGERVVLALSDVRGVVKAKPFAVLPGSGMSVEVTLKSREKYLFSAILNRDQAYQAILDQAMILGLPWGTDLEAHHDGGGETPSLDCHDNGDSS